MRHLVTCYLRDSASVPKETPSSKRTKENHVQYDSLLMSPIVNFYEYFSNTK